jgi:hypothetical protein
LVVHNVSDVEVTIKLDGDLDNFDDVKYYSKDDYTWKDNELKLPAFSTVILE